MQSSSQIITTNKTTSSFLGVTHSIEPISYGNVSGWLAGWVVLYQNDKTYLKTFSTIW